MNTCWYCNKILIEPIATYRRKHKKASKQTDMTVHLDCYKRIKSQENKYLTRGYGSVTQ